MIFLVALLAALSVGLLTMLVVQLMPAQPATVRRRLLELEQLGGNPFDPARQRQRQTSRERWSTVINQLGEKVEARRSDSWATRRMLVQAGYRDPGALSTFLGIRTALPVGAIVLGLVWAPLVGPGALLIGFALAGVGWVAPVFVLGAKARRRQKELQKALPDALDALVVCVEAGLGLNQAIVRVAEEIRHISVAMSEDLALVNLEIRAGTPREDALRNLADRTGLEDIRSLVTMLIQTDRFGTSVAQALRVQSDTMRTKRRQRAEEAAAKTTIKLLFPLVFCVFPAIFVVVLGPGVIQIIKVLGNVQFG